MSNIIYVFRVIILPFHFLWISSILSIQIMIKGFNPFNKSNISSLSNCNGQTTYLKKEIEKTMDGDKHSETILSTDRNLGQRPQKLVEKCHKIALNPKTSNPQQQKSNNSDNNVSTPQTDVVSIPNGEFKLKVRSNHIKLFIL